jgi:hypothetical protein
MTAIPTLSELVKASAERMKDVTVDLDRSMGTVAISCDSAENDIFFEGHEAEEFLQAVDKLYEETGDCTEDECALNVAEPYAENIWN